MKIARVHIEQIRAGEETEVLVVLYADNEASGVGEAASTRIPRVLAAALETAAQYLLGQDPLDRNSILVRLAKSGSSDPGEMLPAVLNGIEAACLDLAGKQLGVPACQLFGGAVRNQIRVCATGWHDGCASLDDWAKRAERVARAGFTALALDPFSSERTYNRWPESKRATDIVRRVRETVGGDIHLVVDAKNRFTAPEAIAIAEKLLPLSVFYLRDPVRCGDLDALEQVRHAVPIPVAFGRYGANEAGLRQIVERQLADFIHLDCVRLGGISRARDFALLAESWFMDVTLHHSGGPVAWAANAQIAAATSNFLMADLPYPVTKSWNEMMNASFELKNGCLTLACGSGLGVDWGAWKNNPQCV